jgi:SAM-dependent methyltransferase
MATSFSHPIFARFYGRMAAGAEKAGAAEHRREPLAGLTGKVIEVRAGNGLNFGYYLTTVTQLVAVEPEPRLGLQAAQAAARAAIPITVGDGTADRLPSAHGQFDAVVASLVLCSVPDQAGAPAELFRVIRPEASCATTNASDPTYPNTPASKIGATGSGLCSAVAATPTATPKPPSNEPASRSRSTTSSSSSRAF